tara:strand:+ start:36 stop:395 length:360 start_codon:yes stop_codon:yes gene_type:complete
MLWLKGGLFFRDDQEFHERLDYDNGDKIKGYLSNWYFKTRSDNLNDGFHGNICLIGGVVYLKDLDGAINIEDIRSIKLNNGKGVSPRTNLSPWQLDANLRKEENREDYFNFILDIINHK